MPPFPIPPARADRTADAIVVGGGYAGLSAAVTLARGGRSTILFEAEKIGDGAATRAAGSLGHVPKATLKDLTASYGAETAQAVYREAREARDYVERFIRENQIECGLTIASRFVAAHSPRAFERQKATFPALRETWGDIELIEKARVPEVIESDAFFGGIKINDAATLQPALFLWGLARLALASGVSIVEHTRVLDVKRIGRDFEVITQNGTYRANDVILATNAQTGIGMQGFQSLRRRLIPIPAFALASEEVKPELVKRVLPVGGPVSDTYKIINYISPNENGRRFIVSARAGRSDRNLRTKAERMFRYFVERFPALAGVKVSHCWTGTFAITGDWIPHLGIEDGVQYVLGCCGTGIPMSTYLGFQAASKILNPHHPRSIFERPLPPLPFFGAGAWLLPLAVRLYEARDRFFR